LKPTVMFWSCKSS